MVAKGQVVQGGGAPHTHAWADITGEPETFPPATHSHTAPTWTDVTGKPTAFPPDTHSHSYASVGDVQALEDRVTTLEGAPAGGSSRVTTRGYITSGDLTPQVTGSWAILAGSPLFAVPAVAGDEIELQITALNQPNANTFLDLAVVSGGLPVKYSSTGTAAPAVEGDPGMYPDAGFPRLQGPAWNFVAESGDISGGSVTVAFAVKSAGGAGKIYAGAAYPLRWTMINHGSTS